MSLIQNLEEAIRQDEREQIKRRLAAAIEGDVFGAKVQARTEATPATPRKRQRRAPRTERQVTDEQVAAVAVALYAETKDGQKVKPSYLGAKCDPPLTRKTVGACCRVLVAQGRAIEKRGWYQIVEIGESELNASQPDGIDHQAEGDEAAQ